MDRANGAGRLGGGIGLRKGSIGFGALDRLTGNTEFDGGHRVTAVEDGSGNPVPYTINGTMMRVDLERPLPPGESAQLHIAWSFPIPERPISRMGRERFENDGNWLYEIAQWFPWLCVYSDNAGWQNKQFMFSEFALEFGDYDVSLTVPDDYIVAATGELQNPRDVLTAQQRVRFEESKIPLYIVTPDEAERNEESTPTGTKTWRFKADNVRDFAWATSRKFIWAAMGHELEGAFTHAMSFFPKEGDPLWSQYSTQSIAYALDTYGRVPFPCPTTS
jgi:hypothetical protein